VRFLHGLLQGLLKELYPLGGMPKLFNKPGFNEISTVSVS